MTGIGGGSGRSGDGFRCIVLGELRNEVGGKGGSLGWSRSGELFYGTDVVIGSLRREREAVTNKLRLRTGEDAGRGKYLWRWLVSLEFLEIQILDEIYTVQS